MANFLGIPTKSSSGPQVPLFVFSFSWACARSKGGVQNMDMRSSGVKLKIILGRLIFKKENSLR